MRRFSRLYPLHFATLLFVAAAFLAFGPYIYESDAYHFVLNVLLASSIGFEKGYSFNGPSWSISVVLPAWTMARQRAIRSVCSAMLTPESA